MEGGREDVPDESCGVVVAAVGVVGEDVDVDDVDALGAFVGVVVGDVRIVQIPEGLE